MNPTEDLIIEHNSIKLMLDIMSKISESIKAKNVFYTIDVEKIVDFLFVYIDQCHRLKEEKIFYPAFTGSHLPVGHDPEDLINEHILGNIYLKEIICCVENCKMGSTFSCDRIADCMINYVHLIRHHMQKEEKIYFSIAEKVLSKEAQTEMSEQFKTIDEEFFGHGVHKRFDEYFKDLKVKYQN